MPIEPLVLADKVKAKVHVEYNRVPLPSVVEVNAACHLVESLHKQRETIDGPVDVTMVVDLCMRFTCLAYRRNSAHGKRRAAITCELCEGGVELQVNAKNGAHGCVYLLAVGSAEEPRLAAVLTFKGSTANVQDWRANLRSTVAASRPFLPGSDAHNHPGWLIFLDALVDMLEQFELQHLPPEARARLPLPADSSMCIWRLLTSPESMGHVLCVGHSLGGALACLAATRIGCAAQQGRSEAGAASPPCLVTFGCPVVGNAQFVDLQNRTLAPCGGLRVYNRFDPVTTVGHGGFALSLAVGSSSARTRTHGGLPIELRNNAKLHANPHLNHLTYVIDSFECLSDAPCVRAKYVLPGIYYAPDRQPGQLESDLRASALDEASASAVPTPDDASDHGGSSSWRELSGRRTGGVGYAFGDVTRSLARWIGRARSAPEGAGPGTGGARGSTLDGASCRVSAMLSVQAAAGAESGHEVALGLSVVPPATI